MDDTIVKPVLTAARANKHIETLPNQHNVILEAYRPGTRAATIPGQAPGLPPPILVKFTNSAMRLAFLRNKRASLPSPSEAEKAAGVKRYGAAEDLTAVTYKKMRELIACEKVEKVWSYDGQLRYTLPGDRTVLKVKSVYMSIDDILKKSG